MRSSQADLNLKTPFFLFLILRKIAKVETGAKPRGIGVRRKGRPTSVESRRVFKELIPTATNNKRVCCLLPTRYGAPDNHRGGSTSVVSSGSELSSRAPDDLRARVHSRGRTPAVDSTCLWKPKPSQQPRNVRPVRARCYVSWLAH
jgi:hypothetical protein